MAQTRFNRTVDAVYKLGSYPVPQNGRTVTTMDKITAQELKGAIFEDSHDSSESSRTRALGYVLDTIFADFSAAIPSADSLTVNRQTVKKFSPSIVANYPDDAANIPLYNSSERRWNWPFPTRGDTTLEQATKAAFGGKLEGGWQETLVAVFLNTVSAALEPVVRGSTAIDQEGEQEQREGAQEGELEQRKEAPYRHWLATHSNRRLPGAANGAGAYDRHPDLMLLESAAYATESISWLSPTVLGEYTTETWKPNMRLVKTLHTKSYLTFLEQPWRRFVLCLSICRQEMRLHFYDRSGVCVSPPFNICDCPADFLTILAAVVFGPRLCIGFDPTVTVLATCPLRTVRRKVIQASSGVPSTIDEEETGETEKSSSEDGNVTPPTTDASDVGIDDDETGDSEQEEEEAVSQEDEDVSQEEEDVSQDEEADSSDEEADSQEDEVVPPTTCASYVDIIGLMRNEPVHILFGEPGPSRPPPARIGRIRANDHWYDIEKMLFSSPGFLGRGTIIYLASRNGQTYVVKDHWVENASNEVKMMNRVKGIVGVPEVTEHWQVEVEGTVDTTSRYRPKRGLKYMKGHRTHVRIIMSPCGRPLTQFKTKHELIRCVRDVLNIQSEAVERGILHRDTSPFNVLIRDLVDGVCGMLIDWEFAVEITEESSYSVGGTGTIPFLSRSLLGQISDGLKQRTVLAQNGVYKDGLVTSVTLASTQGDFTLIHKPGDDIESLFYVLLWVMILYNGPGGQKREDFNFETSILSQWTENSILNLDAAKNSKNSLITEPPYKLKLADHVSPYFRDLGPLLDDWREVFRLAHFHGHTVEVEPCLNVLNSYLARIPLQDDDSSIRLARAEKTKILKDSLPQDMATRKLSNAKKREREIRSFGDIPLQVKRSRDES